MYELLSILHPLFAAISIAGFLARGAGRVAGAGWVHGKAAKIAPHVNDTLLLLSGVGLAGLTAQWAAPWLWAKLVALLIYIGFGLVAFRLGRTPAQRGLAFAAAVLVFAYIVAVALTRASWPL